MLGVCVSVHRFLSTMLIRWLHVDVEIHHLETARPLEFSNVSVVTQGPLRASVKAEVKYDKSTISVVVRFLVTFFIFIVYYFYGRSLWTLSLVLSCCLFRFHDLIFRCSLCEAEFEVIVQL